MNDAKRAFLVILAHYFTGLACCLVFSFALALPAGLIAPFAFAYRLRAGVILFATYMPALQLSGILVGYAIAFKARSDDRVERWSAVLIEYLKGAFALCVACLAAYFIMVEGVSPVLNERQLSARNRSVDYREFIEVASASLAANDPSNAEIPLRGALQIWPKSVEARKLMDRCEYLHAERAAVNAADGDRAEESAKAGNLESGPVAAKDKGIGALEALDRSDAAFARHDYFNAHYYAMLAWRLCRDTDPNKALALKKAGEAWNRVTEGQDKFTEQGDIARYRTKRAGYEAIQNGDFLKAYYILLAEQERQKAGKSGGVDPDVVRFLEIARTGLLESYFFIDETANIRLFESARDIFFVNRRSDGSLDAVFIRGMTSMRSAGRDVAYLRDVEISRIGRDGKAVWRIFAPYAKMFPFVRDGKSRPELILHAVDRNRIGGDILPEVVEGEVPPQERSVLLLDMPYADLDLVIAANRGPAGMSLPEMLKFSASAEKYGFSRDLYQREILNRVAEPFLVLILSIYALILGWKYRLGKGVFFRAWWALAIPLFPVVSLFVIETLRYLARLFIAAFVSLVPRNGLVPTLIFLTVSFLAVSFAFFSQRSD